MYKMGSELILLHIYIVMYQKKLMLKIQFTKLYRSMEKLEQNGKLDIMVNNAVAIDYSKPNILGIDVTEFEHVATVNLIGPFLGTSMQLE